MLAAKVNISLMRIISSKKKVLEIQHLIASKRIRNNKASFNGNISDATGYSRVIQNYESSIQKLNFIESCVSDNEYIIINLLCDDRYETLSMLEIYDELLMNSKREVTVTHQYQKMAQTG